ncbi:hypothetical protein AB0K62_33645, partial [Streptomyces halstedii]
GDLGREPVYQELSSCPPPGSSAQPPVRLETAHYLAPVAHLQLESILAAAEPADEEEQQVEGLEGVFTRLARESVGIQDIDAVLEAAR